MWIISFVFPPNSELTEVINACQSVLTFSHGKDTCSGVSSYRRLALGKRQVPQVCLDIGKKLDQKKNPTNYRELTGISWMFINTPGGMQWGQALVSAAQGQNKGPWAKTGALEAPPGPQKQFCACGATALAQAVLRGAGGPPGELQQPPGRGLGTSWGWPCWGALGQRHPEVQ